MSDCGCGGKESALTHSDIGLSTMLAGTNGIVGQRGHEMFAVSGFRETVTEKIDALKTWTAANKIPAFVIGVAAIGAIGYFATRE